MSEGTDPSDPVVCTELVGPPVRMLDTVIVSAERCEIAVTRLAAVDNRLCMVDIAHDGWHAASGEYAGSVSCVDPSLLGHRRPS